MQNSKERSTLRRTVALGLLCAAALAAAITPSRALARQIGVYCVDAHPSPGLSVFAGQVLAGGRLKFGLSKWNSGGRHIGLYGVARGGRGHWRYVSRAAETGRCRVDIRLLADGGLEVAASAVEGCRGAGGRDTEIGLMEFPPSAYEGLVSRELQDEETFFGKAGKCWKKHGGR